jgi:hypothetical protein
MQHRRWLVLLGACGACSAEPHAKPSAESSARAALALAFDGNDDYATLGTAAFPFAEAQQSLSLWLARGDGGEAEQAVVVLRKDFESGFALGFRAARPEVWSIYSGNSYVLAESELPVGEWHHVAYVFDGATHFLYLDGVLLASGTYPPNNRTPTSAWLGSLDGRSSFYAGNLDGLRLWAAARSAQEIADEAGGSLSGDRSALVASLSFDETEGGRAFDDSGLGNHATLGDGDALRSPERVPSMP